MTATELGHNPNATGEDIKRHVEDTSTARFHPDPKVRREAQERLDGKGSGPNWADFTPEQKAEFERRLREQNSRRGISPVQVSAPPAEVKISLDQIREIARAVYGMDLVAIGDKPSDAGWAARVEAEKAVLQGRIDEMYLRATTAEKTAADAIRELRKLKEVTGDTENGR